MYYKCEIIRDKMLEIVAKMSYTIINKCIEEYGLNFYQITKFNSEKGKIKRFSELMKNIEAIKNFDIFPRGGLIKIRNY